jgi:hypothetical protein
MRGFTCPRGAVFVSAAFALATAACSGKAAVYVAGSGGSSTGSTGSTASGSSGGTGGSQGMTVTLTMDSFPVPAGAEVYNCQNFANPFGGMDAQVSEFESHMTANSHHLLLFWEDSTSANYLAPGSPPSAIQKCSGLEFAATPYGSQQQDDSLSFPAGVAALMPANQSFRIQSHYLNTTGSDIMAHVEVIFHLAEPGTVMNQAGVLFVVDPKIHILPASSATVTDDCTLPQDMYLMRAMSHMHRHGTSFTASIAGTTIYQTTAWSDPKPTIFSPPNSYKMGDALHFQCSFTNTGTTTLTFGESALTNEMCIFSGAFYPIQPGNPLVTGSNCVMGQM